MSEWRSHDEACGVPVVVPLTLLLIVSACAEGADGGSEGLSSAEEPIMVSADAVHRVGTSELISQVRDMEIGGEDATGAGTPSATPRIREVRLPEEFIALRLDEERAWGMVLDEYDVPTVAWLELP